jgi:hypothetical protein
MLNGRFESLIDLALTGLQFLIWAEIAAISAWSEISVWEASVSSR